MRIVAFFQLIRWKNLLIIFLMQLLVSGVLLPKFTLTTDFLQLNFWLVSISTICIAAGGYIINDIIDIPIDVINKKNKIIVDHIISKKRAFILFILFTFSGIALGGIASVIILKPLFVLLFILLSTLLVLYSTTFKSILLLGNIVIALLVSCSILIIALFEFKSINTIALNTIYVYSIFAFIINLLREIIKDIEDINGDKTLQLNTLPIQIGRHRTKRFLLIFSIAFVSAIVFLLFSTKELDVLTRIYGSFLVVLPTVYFISKLHISKVKKDYTKLSSLLKIIMLLGMGSIFTL